MDISTILAAANPDSSKTSTSTSKLGADYNQFLSLLTTQLKNQDPLSPMDSTEFTNQLVQFSNVEQSIRSNDYLQKLLSLQSLNLTSIGLSYVGLDVQMPGNKVEFDGESSAALYYKMPANVAQATLSIIDKNGAVVYSSEPDKTAGEHTFVWNGKDFNGDTVPAGIYEIRVGAADTSSKAMAVDSFVTARVTGVQSEDDGNVSLVIGNQLVPVTNVRRATLPGTLL